MDQLTIDVLPVLKAFLEWATDAAYVVDRQFNLVWVNAAYREFFGYRRRHHKLCHEVAQMAICGTDQCLLHRCSKSGNRTAYADTEVRGSPDDQAVCATTGLPLRREPGGEVVAVVGLLRDVSVEVRLHRKYREMLAAERDRKEQLARMVAERTAELVQANEALQQTNLDLDHSRQEIAEILANIRQAIMTIDERFRIGRESSSFCDEVFASGDLAGCSFPDLMLAGEDQRQKRRELEEWLKLAFHSPTLDWGTVKTLVQREFQFRRDDGQLRELVVDWQPIREEGYVKRIMVIADDLTEKRALERSLHAKQDEMQESIEHLAELARADPEMYELLFLEAHEIIEEATAALEGMLQTSDRTAVIAKMYRGMHTLKGNAMSAGLLRIAAKAHWVEDAFAALRDSAQDLTPTLIGETEERVKELSGLLGRIEKMANKVLSQKSSPSDLGQVRGGDRPFKLEIDPQRLEQLLAWIQAHAQDVSTGQGLHELMVQVRTLGLVPMRRLYQRFPKMIEDLGDKLGKSINPVCLQGDDVALHPSVFNKLASVMVHLVRNALDHGVEPPEVRIKSGKPAYATVSVTSALLQERVRIEISDDGRGIDAQALRQRAIRSGTIGQDDDPSDDKALELIFMPGFSTAQQTTDISGRGVGMDVVRSSVEELGGSVTIETEVGRGTTFRIELPRDAAQGQPAPLIA